MTHHHTQQCRGTNGTEPNPNQTGVQKAGEATRLLLEAFFHLGFVLSFILIVGTPVSMCVPSFFIPAADGHPTHPLTHYSHSPPPFSPFHHPPHSYYTPGNYCNFYWSNQCTNGQNMGTSLPRFIATCIAACYTGACARACVRASVQHRPTQPSPLLTTFLHPPAHPHLA